MSPKKRASRLIMFWAGSLRPQDFCFYHGLAMGIVNNRVTPMLSLKTANAMAFPLGHWSPG